MRLSFAIMGLVAFIFWGYTAVKCIDHFQGLVHNRVEAISLVLK